VKWFGKMKSWAAFVICVLFFTGCGVEPQNKAPGSMSMNGELESAVTPSVPEVSNEENTSDTAEISSKAEQTESFVSGGIAEENDAASSRPAASSAAPQSSRPAASSAAPQSSRPAASSAAPQSSRPAASSAAPQSSRPAASSAAPQSSRPAASSAAPQSSKPAATSVPSGENNLLQVARQVIVLVNQERSKQGLPALRENTQLMESALVRSQEIVTKFAHERPNGEQGYQLAFRAGFNTVGENIAYGYSSAEQVMEGWMNSPGHRANILNAGFLEIGVGCYRGSDGRLYWTQLFGG
jgi:uncharacterized protein YkwD